MSKQTALYRIVSLLSLVVLACGLAAAPTSQLPRGPLTPVQASYADWNQVPAPAPAPVTQLAGQVKPNAIQPASNPVCGGSTDPNPWTSYIYTGQNEADNYNEDIYFQRGFCTPASPVRLTSDPAHDFYPRLNLDASRAVFVSNRDGNNEIYAIHTDGSGLTRLTNNPAGDSMPAFSPDGKQVVFASDRSGDAEIFVMNADGGNVRQLTYQSGVDVEPDWSPDGAQITWIHRDSSQYGAVYVMNVDGSGQHAVTDPYHYAYRPVWSPDSAHLAFTFDADDNADGWLDSVGVVTLGLAGVEQRRVNGAGTNEDFEMGGWSPDENKLFLGDIRYILYNNQWYIYSANLVYGDMPALNPIYLVEGQEYSYNPHVRSLDNTPPVSHLQSLPEWTQMGDIFVPFTAYDTQSGLRDLYFQYQSNTDPSWYDASNYPLPGIKDITGALIFTSDMPGQRLSFRVRATDVVGNQESIKQQEEAYTTVFRWQVTSQVTDMRDHPLAGAKIQVNALDGQTLSTDSLGAVTFHVAETQPYQATVTKTGYGAIPSPQWPVDRDMSVSTVLTGPSEQLVNGFFNNTTDPLTGWEALSTTPAPQPITGRYGGSAIHITDAAAGSNGIRQTLSIPVNIYQPTLSLFYRLNLPFSGTAQSGLHITFTPQGGDPADLVVIHTASDWTHAWADLSPWLGQTGTLTIQVDQDAAEGLISADIAEVSVSAWNTPIIHNLSQSQVPYPVAAETWVTIDGENFSLDAQVYLNGTKVTTLERPDANTLRILLPTNLKVGRYSLRVVNTGGADATWPYPMYVGSPLFLPVIAH